jgi:hypothetical protein
VLTKPTHSFTEHSFTEIERDGGDACGWTPAIAFSLHHFKVLSSYNPSSPSFPPSLPPSSTIIIIDDLRQDEKHPPKREEARRREQQ